MEQPSVTGWRSWIERSRDPIAIGVIVLATEFVVLALYLLTAAVRPQSIAIYLVPFVWINVGLLALWRVRPAPESARQRRLALGTAGGYLLVLSVAGGIFSPGHVLHGHAHSTGFRIASLPPGWGPALL